MLTKENTTKEPMKRQKWTPEQTEFVVKVAGFLPEQQIAEIIGRTSSSVSSQISALGLYKSSLCEQRRKYAKKYNPLALPKDLDLVAAKRCYNDWYTINRTHELDFRFYVDMDLIAKSAHEYLPGNVNSTSVLNKLVEGDDESVKFSKPKPLKPKYNWFQRVGAAIFGIDL